MVVRAPSADSDSWATEGTLKSELTPRVVLRLDQEDRLMISTGFTSLDRAIGGLSAGKDYLVYGPVGSGKTAFGLNFLYAGLKAGEVVALITRRSPRMIFDHGRAFGWDLESFVSDSQLILVEYTPKILQNTLAVGDEVHIVSELRHTFDGTEVQRMVFDPFTPMLEGASAVNVAFRCRALLD